MPITLDKPAISSLKNYKIITELEYTYFGLRLLKNPDNSTQDIDPDAFEYDWGIPNTALMKHLQSLEAKKALKITPGPVTITWGESESTTISQNEVLSMKKDGLINTTTYVYYLSLIHI